MFYGEGKAEGTFSYKYLLYMNLSQLFNEFLTKPNVTFLYGSQTHFSSGARSDQRQARFLKPQEKTLITTLVTQSSLYHK